MHYFIKTLNALPNIYKFIIPKDIYHDTISNTQHRTIKFIPMQKKKLSYPFFFKNKFNYHVSNLHQDPDSKQKIIYWTTKHNFC